MHFNSSENRESVTDSSDRTSLKLQLNLHKEHLWSYFNIAVRGLKQYCDILGNELIHFVARW